MPKAAVIIYDLNMRRVAMLENAFDIGYETPFNGLWTANFSLPATDEKNAECKPLYFAEIFDGDQRVDLFRIVPTDTKRGDGPTITYQLEHALATLLDDVLFQYHQVGNLGVYTAAVLQYILNQQTTIRWQLGTLSFARQFEYKWENDNLLAAVFSVPKPFIEDFHWTWDTSSFPWTLNLVAAETQESAYIRYGKNMQGIEKNEDPTSLCTRLYCLGYGEGVNQLTIREVNGGVPYLDASTSVVNGGQYPIISRTFVDRRYESAETLKARGQVLLEELKLPRITYQVDASELYRLTKEPIDKFRSGAMVRVIDAELGINVITRIVNVKKPDVLGDPGNVQIEIANRPLDVASSISDLENRQRINEVYSQGATNLDSHDFADNCDPAHPAVIRFYLPSETVRINKMSLSYEVGPFRGYSKGAAAGGGATSGSSSASTTAAGGATTSSSSSASTTAAGGATTSSASSSSTTESGGGTVVSQASVSSFSDDFDHTLQYNTGTNTVPVGTDFSNDHYHTVDDSGFTGDAGDHTHLVDDHVHTNNLIPHTHDIPGHSHTIPAHNHGMDHTHTIGSHSHGMDHTHTIGSHSHGMEHTHQISAHTHDMVYGIFEGPTPTSLTVTVDGNAISGLGTSGTDVDIIPYLAKDGEGKVTRGSWHEIKITPNNLGRVVANVVTQLFVQSRGGGNY